MYDEKFSLACAAAAQRERAGIGTMGEKGIHNALKHFYEPDESCHEIAVGGYVADIVGEHGVIEIQTTGYSKMHDKLARFLEVTNVTVVWPCVVKKRIIKIDAQTGEVLSSRISPKKQNEYDLMGELWGVRDLLTNERLTMVIACIEAEEYRTNDIPMRGRRRKKGGANRIERLPTAFVGEIRLENTDDYRRFIPVDLPEQFTVKDYQAKTGMDNYDARTALNIFAEIGILTREGKRGNALLFGRTK